MTLFVWPWLSLTEKQHSLSNKTSKHIIITSAVNNFMKELWQVLIASILISHIQCHHSTMMQKNWNKLKLGVYQNWITKPRFNGFSGKSFFFLNLKCGQSMGSSCYRFKFLDGIRLHSLFHGFWRDQIFKVRSCKKFNFLAIGNGFFRSFSLVELIKINISSVKSQRQ